MFRHLRMAKRAGRAHDPAGIENTKLGDLAVQCPTCPRADVNLPPDYQDVPQNIQYVLFS
jgi:hypothetical protein